MTKRKQEKGREREREEVGLVYSLDNSERTDVCPLDVMLYPLLIVICHYDGVLSAGQPVGNIKDVCVYVWG